MRTRFAQLSPETLRQSNKIRWIIGFSFFLTMVFMIVPWSPEGHRFTLANMETQTQNYVYHFFEKLFLVALTYVMATELTRYRFLLGVFVFFAIDFVDFVLTFNHVWYMCGPFPIGWNTVGGGIVVFGSLLWVEDR